MRFIDLLAADHDRLRTLSGQPEAKVSGPVLVLRCFAPRLLPVLLYRASHALHVSGLGRLAKLPGWLNFVLFGIEIPARLEIGPGLVLPHTHGTVLGAWRIGADAMIFQGVTLGAKSLDMEYREDLRPTLGDRVTVGAGAKVLGASRIGDGATIGANAVVTGDVPAGATAVGIPARIVPHGDA
jgi:serine O-acetyltransferase